MLDDFKAAMKREFEMTYLGLMKYLLGIEVKTYNFSCVDMHRLIS